MPRVEASKLAPAEIYGKVQVDNKLSFGERVRKRFRPTDTVKVHNITDQTVRWQWLDELDETYQIEDGTNIKIVDRKDPGVWELGPGEHDILPGSCAYLMIEALFKMVSIAKTGITIHPLDERQIKNFALDDPQQQEEIIDLVFETKITPQMMVNVANSSIGDMTPKVIKNLPALSDEHTEYADRTGQQLASAVPVLPPVTPVQHTELSDLGKEFAQEVPEAPTASTQSEASTDEPTKPAAGVPAPVSRDAAKAAPVKQPAAKSSK